MTLYVLCGIPGSGKTTKASELNKELNTKLYSYDTIKRNSKLKTFDEVCELIFKNIKNDLLNGFDVIYDAPHTKVKHRDVVLKNVSNINCKKILIVMDTPLNECVRRNSLRSSTRVPESILYDFYHKFEPPTLEEGWDEIIEIKN